MEVGEVAHPEVVEIHADTQCRRPNVTKGQTARTRTILLTKVQLTTEQTNSIQITLHTTETQVRQLIQDAGGKEWIKRVHLGFNHMPTKRKQIRTLSKEHKERLIKTMTIQMVSKNPAGQTMLTHRGSKLIVEY